MTPTIPPVADDEAWRIAASLTKIQRVAILWAQQTCDNRVLVDSGPILAGERSLWPQGVCRYYSARFDALTPLGLRVRAALQNGEASDE